MALAEAAAERSLAQPDHTPEPQPDQTVAPPAPARADPALAFTRLARCVRQTMSLENTIATERFAVTEPARQREANRAAIAALHGRRTPAPSAEPASNPPPPTSPTHTSNTPTPPPIRPDDNPFPSILTNISREIGIDLTEPTLPSRLPSKPAFETLSCGQNDRPTPPNHLNPAPAFPQIESSGYTEPPGRAPPPGLSTGTDP